MASGEAKLFTRNLPQDITEETVRYIFGKYGTLLNVDVVMWPAHPSLGPSGRLLPLEVTGAGQRERPQWHACAFVTYTSAEAAATAVRALHNVYRVKSGSPEPVSVFPARPSLSAAAEHAAPPGSSSEEAAAGTAAAACGGHAEHGSGGFFATGVSSATASHVAEKTRCKLFVGNLHADLQKESLVAAFSPYGRIVNVHIMTGKSKFGSACAFVELSNPLEADVALRAMHQRYEPRIGTSSAPITVTYFQSQSSGKAGQALAAMAGTGATVAQAAHPRRPAPYASC